MQIWSLQKVLDVYSYLGENNANLNGLPKLVVVIYQANFVTYANLLIEMFRSEYPKIVGD